MPGKALINEGFASVEEFQDTPILADDRLEDAVRLLDHGLSQLVVEAWKPAFVRMNGRQESKLEPLVSKALNQGPGPLIDEHAPDLAS